MQISNSNVEKIIRKNSFSSNSSACSEYSYSYEHQNGELHNSEIKHSNSANYKSSWLVYIAVFCCQMSSISMGSALGWSSPALAALKINRNVTIGIVQDTLNLDYDKTLENWIASSLTIGAFSGAFLCGFLMDIFGRRMTIIFLGIPFGIGWTLITISWTFWPIIIGRFFTGIAIGITTAVVPTYITEISTPDNRGRLGMTFNFFVVGGMFFMDFVYIFKVHWYHLSMAALFPVIIFTITMFFMPESPVWAINKIKNSTKSIEVARDALKKLRTIKSDQQGELNELIRGAVRNTLNDDNDSCDLNFCLKFPFRRDVYIPMSIGACLLFFQQFCGINAIQFYLHEIFESAKSTLDPKISALISNGFMLISTVIGSIIIERFGRRKLYIISALGLMLSIGSLGVHILINDNEVATITTPATTITTKSLSTTLMMERIKNFVDLSNINNTNRNIFQIEYAQQDAELMRFFADNKTLEKDDDHNNNKESKSSLIPLICTTCFGIAFSMGVGPICWIIITEITPPQTIEFIVTTSSAFAWIFTFLVVQFTGDVKNLVGVPGTYFGFATLSFISAVFIYFLPETKGKTNEELCRIFRYD